MKYFNFKRYKFTALLKNVSQKIYSFSKVYKYLNFERYNFSNIYKYFKFERYNFNKIYRYLSFKRYDFAKIIGLFRIKHNNRLSIRPIQNKNRFIADPFLVKNKNKNYIFVEDYSLKRKKGLISCYEL